MESKSSRDNDKHDWYLWRDGKKGCQCYCNPFLCNVAEKASNGEVQYPPNNWQRLVGGKHDKMLCTVTNRCEVARCLVLRCFLQQNGIMLSYEW